MQTTKYLTISWLVASLMLIVASGCDNGSSDTGCPGNKNPWGKCDTAAGGAGGSNTGGSSSGNNTGGSGGSSGNASTTCDFPLAQCYTGPCTDLRTDKDNCGACGFDCGDFATCVNGTCKTICQPTGAEICDGKDNNCDGNIDEGLLNLCGKCGPVPAEECDGLDNNCNGSIDEGCDCQEGKVKPCGTTLGECTTGSQTCIDGEWSLCSGNPPTVETCNGKDDNCDGTKDDGCECVAGDQRSCGTDLGSCSKGMQLCVNGHWNTCSGVAPVSETCNGADDNCDGLIDEGCPCSPGATQNCSTDLGECTIGQQVCVNGSWSACSGVLPTVETCDGKDNNCDGNIDEDLRNACGACGPSLPDTCNGVDDDCDGTIDNGCDCQTGQTMNCGSTLGTCTLGTQICVAGHWSLCSGNPPKTDVCGDGLDNDCNGTIDQNCECTFGDSKPCSTDLGECTIGTQKCDNTGHWGACSGILPTVEACDGLDNNCDGVKDNGCPCTTGTTQNCSTNLGECTIGQQVCVGGSWTTCSGTMPTVEVCGDGKDNNCDGFADNGCECVLGDIRDCGTDLGLCTKGKQTCNAFGHWSDCTGIAPTVEACDGLDNNCDGIKDNGCPCTSGQTEICGVAKGQCTEGTRTCVGGTWTTCSGVKPGSEICDGIDNDCDGDVDEGVKNACGSCGPTPVEACDGIDNNCNGIADEGCECKGNATKPCGSVMGTCTIGVQTCINGIWSLCSGNPPKTDVCGDGLDNDCNGTIDQDCECSFGDSKPCGVNLGECTAGTQKCDNTGHWGACSGKLPTVEVCGDGKDNNCDGIRDNDCECVFGDVKPCGSTLGTCTKGTQTCSNTGHWLDCTGIAPATEACDGLDNNCDGIKDNNCPCITGTTQNCSTDLGECTIGQQVCVNGSWSACSGVLPTVETCDGKDNNCDGNIDEDLRNACGACGPSLPDTCNGVDDDCDGTIDNGCDCQTGQTMNCGSTLGTCTLGTQICVAGHWSLCSGNPPKTDVCGDGLDNDCNGTIDQNCECTFGDSKPCSTDLGECTIGTQKCDNTGHWGACSGVLPTVEACDGKDNNCDGIADEGCPCSPGATQNCSTDLGECTIGQQVCVNGNWGPCSGKLPTVETCDGLDNNCDGIRDNGCECVAGDQRSCGTDLGSCSKGMQLCVNGHWNTCSGVAPVSETCNGADDNCDGLIDEGCPCSPGATQNCSTDLGECTIGQQVCVNGSWSACSGVLPTVETCDGKDNNCDGNIDEDLRNACGACGPSLPDTCNGVDDDCDGTIDNGCDCQTGQTMNCGSTLGTCTLGTQICVAGHWSLCSGNPPKTDVCGDGLDNDCNGTIDQNCECTFGDSKPCSTDLGECTIGTQKCDNTGHWGACSGVLPTVEACDGLDNNCDGVKDNGCSCISGTTQPCGQAIGTCTVGSQTCVNGSWSLCSGVLPKQEKCATALDENCNGLTDEPGCVP